MNNKITEYSHLEALKPLENLVQLDLSECPVSDKSDYRKKVFELLPKLQILDNKDADGNLFDYGEEEGDLEGDEEFGDVEGDEEFGDDGDEEDYQEDDEDSEDAKPSKKLKK